MSSLTTPFSFNLTKSAPLSRDRNTLYSFYGIIGCFCKLQHASVTKSAKYCCGKKFYGTLKFLIKPLAKT